MCGRYSLGLGSDAAALLDLFKWVAGETFSPRYNIAPGTPVPVVRSNPEGLRVLSQLRWGLVPSWAKDEKIAYRLINARSETAAKKPSFRKAFAERRCLLPATGFFEWQRLDPPGKKKQPFHLSLPDAHPFALAGLWEPNHHGDSPLLTCTVLTTRAAPDIEHVHDRMPVIVPREAFEVWLGEKAGALEPLLEPRSGLVATPVSTLVNNPRNDGPELIEPDEAEAG